MAGCSKKSAIIFAGSSQPKYSKSRKIMRPSYCAARYGSRNPRGSACVLPLNSFAKDMPAALRRDSLQAVACSRNGLNSSARNAATLCKGLLSAGAASRPRRRRTFSTTKSGLEKCLRSGPQFAAFGLRLSSRKQPRNSAAGSSRRCCRPDQVEVFHPRRIDKAPSPARAPPQRPGNLPKAVFPQI